LTQEEIVGKSVHDLVPQDLAGPHHEADMALFRQPGVQIYEALDQSADGAKHAVIFNKATFLNSDGTPGGLVGAILDITGRKRAEEALNRRAAQLALINDIGRKIAAALDLNEVLGRAARLVQKSFGYHHVALFTVDNTQGELVMRARAGTFAHLFPLDHQIKLGQGIVGWVGLQGERLLANDVRVEPHYINFYPEVIQTLSELCVPIRLGEENVGVLDVQSPQTDAFDENDVMVMETLADQIAVAIENARLYDAVQRELAERKRIEEALRRHNEELLALNTIATTISQSLDLDHVLNATLDAVLVVMGAEAGWIQLLDQDKKEGGSLLLAAHRGLAKETIMRTKAIRLYESITDQIVQSGQPIVMDQAVDDPLLNMEVSRREGPVAFVAVPIKSKDQVLGMLGFYCRHSCKPSAQDIWLLTTIGHQIGIAIENVRLAEKASEIEVLRELDHLRSELIANTSHELRTPLGLIKVFCTTLLREDVDFDRATQQEFLCDIKEETDKLEEIVDNLLDLSRMQNRQVRLDKCPTDVGQLARKVLGVMEIQTAQHRLVHDFPPEPLVAMVDPKCIEQVLRNLLSNAIKYSPEGGIITVQGRKDEGQLLIQVSDQGMGIPTEDLERIFERFYRVENEITQNVRGVGLGLPVCQGIVEAHGGRIWAESTLGTGSVFNFTLPIGDGSESHPDSPDDSESALSHTVHN
jgi:K+-sensing histidine kinase KdpD